MIFAAGLGTRLGPLGRDEPKALIEIAGRTMLERAAARLVEAGATRIVVNVHHHAERIERFVAAHDLGAEVRVSREPGAPLETGGGLLHARDLLRLDDIVLLQNVDVICGVSLRPLAAAQRSGAALATLAVQERETARRLLFDDAGLLGREDRRDGTRREVRSARGPVRSLAFAGHPRLRAAAARPRQRARRVPDRGRLPAARRRGAPRRPVAARRGPVARGRQPRAAPGGPGAARGSPAGLTDGSARGARRARGDDAPPRPRAARSGVGPRGPRAPLAAAEGPVSRAAPARLTAPRSGTNVRTRLEADLVWAGIAQLVERELPKLEVAGSTPVARSISSWPEARRRGWTIPLARRAF